MAKKRPLGEKALDGSEMGCFKECKAMLNILQLTYIVNSPNDMRPLTPTDLLNN